MSAADATGTADTLPAHATPAARSPLARATTLALPVVLLGALAALLLFANPAQLLDNGAPPPEEIVFDRVELRPGQFVLHLRNAVNEPVTITQVTVDDAYWAFEMEPADRALDGRATGTVTIPYPWVEGEPHAIGVVTHTGLVWKHDVAAAIETPAPGPSTFGAYALIGLLVGVLPVAAGMAFHPLLREAPDRWTHALLAFTLGLLAFLAVDTMEDGLELAEAVPGAYHGLALLLGAALVAIAIVLALDRAMTARGAGPWSLALLIALGIGLHNLGEGLVIGAAYAVGSLALGTTLILGFSIHNVTEGPAIVSPLAKGHRLGLPRWLALAALAGLPTVLGAWLGGFYAGGLLPVLFFGLGAGAILVVLVQVGGTLRREGPLVTGTNLVAFVVGYGVMLATAVLASP